MRGETRRHTRFVILAAPRSGSNLLCTLLNSHPEILCHHEVFNPSGIFYSLDHRDGSLDLGTLEDRDRQPLEFLDRLWRHDLGFPCLGFKMTRGQEDCVLQAVLADREVRKIILRRSNPIKMYVSEMIARHTGRWEVYSSNELPPNPPRVRVDPEELRRHIDFNDAFYACLDESLRGSRQSSFSARYDRLFFADEQRRLLEFLQVSPPATALTAKSIRQNPAPMCELVSNFHELESCLCGTPWVEMLYTDG